MWPNSALSPWVHDRDPNGRPPRDFQRENARHLKHLATKRKMEEAHKASQRQREAARKPLKATRAYDNVQPKVRQRAKAAKAGGKEFLVSHSRSGPFVSKPVLSYAKRSESLNDLERDYLEEELVALEQQQQEEEEYADPVR